ncbi:unnamed protein product [Boreogadus saida]
MEESASATQGANGTGEGANAGGPGANAGAGGAAGATSPKLEPPPSPHANRKKHRRKKSTGITKPDSLTGGTEGKTGPRGPAAWGWGAACRLIPGFG